MNTCIQKCCLDTNVLIQAWQKYYSPAICPSYWEVINILGIQGRIFIPKAVFDEITRTEDDLSKWIKTSNIPVHELSASVTKCLNSIFASNPSHRFLVDNIKQRSLADPWVIAHAMSENACVVTKEEKVTAVNTDKIKIPNVCENMNVRCINDFDFIGEINMRFTCQIL
jgi:rRNA-processing protein FCF1